MMAVRFVLIFFCACVAQKGKFLEFSYKTSQRVVAQERRQQQNDSKGKVAAIIPHPASPLTTLTSLF